MCDSRILLVRKKRVVQRFLKAFRQTPKVFKLKFLFIPVANQYTGVDPTRAPLHPRQQGNRVLTVIDPAQKICIVLPHHGDKNKGVARVGHPNSVAKHKGRIKKRSIGVSPQPISTST
jgi:hypothetical protein